VVLIIISIEKILGENMLEIRWHSRAGQGAVTGAKGLGSVVAETGKEVQAFAFYGSAKRGASMTAYNRIDDKPIRNHEKYMHPDYVFVIDPGLAFTDDITQYGKDTTKYIITSHLSKDELVSLIPAIQGIEDRVFVVDCLKIAQETIGRPIPNTPVLGAFMKLGEGNIEWMPEVLFHQKGAQEDGGDGELSMNYLDIGVNGLFHINDELALAVGPYMGYAVSGIVDGESITDWEYINRIEFGTNLGAIYNINDLLHLDLRYGIAFTDVIEEVSIRNSSIQIGIGYVFSY
jgi:pyruvate ferredoxin oxidoreductase gamma subunit